MAEKIKNIGETLEETLKEVTNKALKELVKEIHQIETSRNITDIKNYSPLMDKLFKEGGSLHQANKFTWIKHSVKEEVFKRILIGIL